MFNNADTFQEDFFWLTFKHATVLQQFAWPFFAAFQIIVVFKYPNELN